MRIDYTQLEFMDLRLRQVLRYLEKKTGLAFTITSLYRINDSGVHGVLPLRGTDLRMRSLEVGQECEKLVNAAFEYDPERSDKHCAVLHGQGANLHLHIQTHSRTSRRDKPTRAYDQ